LQADGQTRRHRALRRRGRQDAPRIRAREGTDARRRRARRRGRDPRDLPAAAEGARVSRSVEIVGVPMDLGGNRRGVDMGPSAIRYAGLRDRLAGLGYAVRDRGNVHGMPFAVALGLADEPFPRSLRASVDGRNAALIAVRSVDPGEKENIKAAGVTAITMADIDRLGMSAAMEKAIAVASRGDGIHLSLD